MYVFIPLPQCFDYYTFKVSVEIEKRKPCSFVFLFEDCFGYLESLEIPCEFEDRFLYFCRKHNWDFDKDCIEFVDHFG